MLYYQAAEGRALVSGLTRHEERPELAVGQYSNIAENLVLRTLAHEPAWIIRPGGR